MPIRTAAVAALAASVLSAPALAQPVTDSFVYQGELMDNGAPANGFYDMEFRVYTAETLGVTPGGGITTVNNVEVVDGLFSVEVDFGVSGVVFDTDLSRWLEIRVSESGVPGTTILAPRQKLVPAPRANYALRAGFAEQSGTTLNDAYDNGNGDTINASVTPVTILNSTGLDAEFRVGSNVPGNGNGFLTVHSETGAPTVRLSGNNGEGGAIILSENNANVFASLEPDFNGDAGFFSVRRDVGSLGFFVDGSFDGTNSTAVRIFGTSPMAFNASETGDDSVGLPVGSISSVEMLNEPGVAEAGGAVTALPSDGSIATIASVTINAPSDGFAIVFAHGELSISHTNGGVSSVNTGVSANPATFASNQDLETRIGGTLPTDLYDAPVSANGVFPVTEGPNTFYFIGNRFTGSFNATVLDSQISAVYIPTAYGNVSRQPGNNIPDELTPTRGPLTLAEIQREQIEALRADNERQERELSDMRERMQRMEQHLNNTNAR